MQFAGLEDGATDQAALVATRAALEVQPGLAPKLAVSAAFTARTDKALGPSPRSHERLALRRRAVLLKKLSIDRPRWYCTLFCAMANLLFRWPHRRSRVAHSVSYYLGGLNHLADQEPA